MTAETEMWQKLAVPFPDHEVKQRPGRGSMTFSYVDARAVMQRLDDVLTPAGWEFTSSVIPGTDIVHGRLTIAGIVREDYGYPNSDKDEEPIKAASSDALKRCGVMFGIGRHLYEDNKPHSRPAAPQRPVERPRVVERVPEEPEFPPDEFAPIGQPENVVSSHECPVHRVPWAGGPGDFWHKDPEGKYCRHPDNLKRPRRAS